MQVYLAFVEPLYILVSHVLPAGFRVALVEVEGPDGALLGIARAAERGDASAIDASRHARPSFEALTPAVLAKLQFDAAAWFAGHRMDQGADDA
jgi:EAL and modified HD-GYP domain-containing signal transduction protein